MWGRAVAIRLREEILNLNFCHSSLSRVEKWTIHHIPKLIKQLTTIQYLNMHIHYTVTNCLTCISEKVNCLVSYSTQAALIFAHMRGTAAMDRNVRVESWRHLPSWIKMRYCARKAITTKCEILLKIVRNFTCLSNFFYLHSVGPLHWKRSSSAECYAAKVIYFEEEYMNQMYCCVIFGKFLIECVDRSSFSLLLSCSCIRPLTWDAHILMVQNIFLNEEKRENK